MILIISKDLDTSTDEIERWLQSFQADFIRINASSLVSDLSCIDLEHDIVTFRDGCSIDLQAVSVVYCRKWFMNDALTVHKVDPKYNAVMNSIAQESHELGKYFKRRLQHARWIDTDAATEITKMEQLQLAASCGLPTPRSIITSKKSALVDFISSCNAVITKPFIAHFSYSLDESLYGSYTEVVNEALLEKLPDSFYPSLFQELIDKQFEVRSMYLNGDFYSLIYFTQAGADVAIDSKKNFGTQGFKTEVFDLPDDIKAKLRAFMQKANLTTGSFDLLFSIHDEFVFIEVNPAGIFENVSHFGNYHIERAFAQTLIDIDNERSKNKPGGAY